MSVEASGRLWLNAALVLAGDREVKVVCPECGEGILEVVDIGSGLGDGLMERVLSCPRCGARNVIRLQGEGGSNRVECIRYGVVSSRSNAQVMNFL